MLHISKRALALKTTENLLAAQFSWAALDLNSSCGGDFWGDKCSSEHFLDSDNEGSDDRDGGVLSLEGLHNCIDNHRYLEDMVRVSKVLFSLKIMEHWSQGEIPTEAMHDTTGHLPNSDFHIQSHCLQEQLGK